MLDKELKHFSEKIKNINNEKKIIEEKNLFSKTFLSPIYEKLKISNEKEKKEIGIKINSLKLNLDNLISKRLEDISFLEQQKFQPEFDIQLPSDYLKTGFSNPLDIIIERLNNFFSALSFEIFNGDEVVSEKYNFTNLNIKEDHPARNMHDSFFLKDRKVLRTHCTSVTAQCIENNSNKEIKIISFGNVYRKDDDDATHSHQFNQLDLVWIKEDLSISNLKWLVDTLLKYLFNDSIKTRYRLSYFPFTEPSFEVDISCFKCSSKGCNVCKKTGWIEVLGAGILHPSVLKEAKIDNKKYIGIAAGIGIDRIAMLKFGIFDIRDIYNNNFRLLEQFRGIK